MAFTRAFVSPGRVEHLFLVYHGGTLLVHLSRIDADEDPDLIASMFTAIDAFVNDSFRRGGRGTVRSIELADYHVALGRGRRTLAFVLYRGPESNRLERRVEREVRWIERRHADVLGSWDGDMDRTLGVQRDLERRWGLRARPRPSLSRGASPLEPLTPLL